MFNELETSHLYYQFFIFMIGKFWALICNSNAKYGIKKKWSLNHIKILVIKSQESIQKKSIVHKAGYSNQ